MSDHLRADQRPWTPGIALLIVGLVQFAIGRALRKGITR